MRALAVELLGYDLEMENFDQSPYHGKEAGSQDKKTYAVQGSREVHLIEGHADTRSRWTGNFTVFSDKQRILDGEIPYVELLFKGQPGGPLELRLQEFVRSSGWGSWITVGCSPKGSYREADILDFLERHLPQWRPGRKWRILYVDDYAPHKCDNVVRLAWSRGYILLPLGGGTTPVAQPCDVALNQHVRRLYTAREVEMLIEKMRDGVKVPRLSLNSRTKSSPLIVVSPSAAPV